jgi:hypothetical protein
MRPFLLLICVGTVLATLGGSAAHGAGRPSIFFADSSNERPGGTAALELFVSLAASAPTAEGLTITAPSGYTLTPKPFGAQLGVAAVTVRTGARLLRRPLVGAIVDTDPAASVDDPVLRACAPGTHTGVWQLMLFGPAQAMVPIAVDELASGGSYKLTVCFDALRSAQLAPVEIDLGLVDVHNPAAIGVYDWSALVTPFDAAGAPDFANASELRGDAPLPQNVTVKATFDAKTKTLTVRGTLRMAGKPRVSMSVNLRGFVPSGGDIDIGAARTTRTGAYVFRKRIVSPALRPGLVSAYVEVSTSACAAASTAPRGCTSESVPGTEAGPAPVAVVGKKR